MTDAALIWSAALALAGACLGVLAALPTPARVRPVVVTAGVVAAIALSGWIDPPWMTSGEGSGTDEDPAARAVAVLRAADPEAFAALTRRLSELREAGAPQAALEAEAFHFAAALHAERAPRLSDAELDRYLSLTRAQYAALAPEHASLCAALLSGRSPSDFSATAFPRAYLEAAAEAGRLVFSSDLESGARMAPAAFDATAEAAIAAVTAEHGAAAVRAAFGALRAGQAEAPDETCAVFVSYLRAVEALPMPDRTRFYRSVLAQG